MVNVTHLQTPGEIMAQLKAITLAVIIPIILTIIAALISDWIK